MVKRNPKPKWNRAAKIHFQLENDLKARNSLARFLLFLTVVFIVLSFSIFYTLENL